MRSALHQARRQAAGFKTTGKPRGEPLANHGQTSLKPAPALILEKTTGTPPSHAHMRTCVHMRTRAPVHVPPLYVPWCELYQCLSGGFAVVSKWLARGFPLALTSRVAK